MCFSSTEDGGVQSAVSAKVRRRRRIAGVVTLLSPVLFACASAPLGERSSPNQEPEKARSEGQPVVDAPPDVGRQKVEPGRDEPGPRSFGYLEVPGFLPAPFGAPRVASAGRGSPLRVLMIAHGAGGRAEHLCSYFEPHLPADFIVVCPQGALLDKRDPEGGAYYPNHLALREELSALSDALWARFGKAVSSQGWRYMGYSQGATMGALAIVGELPIFTELVLMEGGGESWTLARAQAFKEGGGERALLVCGTPACAKRGATSAAALRQVGLDALHKNAPGSGHTYGGQVARLVLEEMARWEAERNAPR